MRGPKYDALSSGELTRRKRRRVVPHEFVLEAIASLEPTTRQMFGCLAVYVGEAIVMILRDKTDAPDDNGVWLATTREHHDSLRIDFPHMRSVRLLGPTVTNWQNLPADSPDFEDAALHACDLVLSEDKRIGKVPKRRVDREPRSRKLTRNRKSRKANEKKR